MSTLTISNLNDGTTTVATTYITNGSAKSWINYKGTSTNAIMESLNMSSVTDNGTGDYTMTFSNAMATAEYSITDGTYRSSGSNSPGITGFESPTANNYIHNHWNSGISVSDMFRTYSQVNGDLA